MSAKCFSFWGTSSVPQAPWVIAPQMKIPGAAPENNAMNRKRRRPYQ